MTTLTCKSIGRLPSVAERAVNLHQSTKNFMIILAVRLRVVSATVAFQNRGKCQTRINWIVAGCFKGARCMGICYKESLAQKGDVAFSFSSSRFNDSVKEMS